MGGLGRVGKWASELRLDFGVRGGYISGWERAWNYGLVWVDWATHPAESSLGFDLERAACSHLTAVPKVLT